MLQPGTRGFRGKVVPIILTAVIVREGEENRDGDDGTTGLPHPELARRGRRRSCRNGLWHGSDRRPVRPARERRRDAPQAGAPAQARAGALPVGRIGIRSRAACGTGAGRRAA